MCTDADITPFVMCGACEVHEKTKNDIVVFVDGAPAGYVKGTQNPCKNNTNRSAFKKDLSK